MEYFFTDQQIMIRDLARRIAEEKIVPVRAELDESEEFPREIMADLASSDLLRVFIPEEYDGLGGGCLDLCLVVEELSRACSAVAISYAASALGCSALIHFGSDEQKKKYLPDIASGKRLAAFALTEAQAGSDAGAIKTLARREKGSFVLNGTKQFITNGGDAEIYLVIALTNPEKGSRGASAIIVEKDTPGFTFGKKEKKMGLRASSTRELVFRDCAVPEENLVGKEGMGFIATLKTLDRSRPGVGAQAVGIAQAALDAAVSYAKERQQFGKPIIHFQAIQAKFADMKTRLEAARLLVRYAAWRKDQGQPLTLQAAQAKVFASEAATWITHQAVQVHGGYGFMKEYAVERYYRDARVTEIYEGTSEMQRLVIARQLISG